MTTTYVPRKIDTDWAKIMVSHIKEGGMLIYPATALAYRVHHSGKLLQLVNPHLLAQEVPGETHNRTRVVFAEIGWEVLP